jgi:hypothetical protein
MEMKGEEQEKRDRASPFGEEIPPDWTEQRILGEQVKDLQKFVDILKKTYGKEQFITWVRPNPSPPCPH